MIRIKRIFGTTTALAILMVTAAFTTFLLLFTPIINSDDDFYMLYTLSGGYGNQPSHILHYLYGWHPFLFYPIAKLFAAFPSFNWYTLFFLVLQVLSCFIIAKLFLSMLTKAVAIGSFVIFFLFFESVLLQSINNSNTSILMGISGCSALLYRCKMDDKLNFKSLFVPSLLLFISGLMRVHTLALCVILFAGMGVVFLPFTKLKRMVLSFVLIGSLLFAFMGIQYAYYLDKIPNFKTEENYRSGIFYLYNHPISKVQNDTGITQVKNSFINATFLQDTSFVTLRDIENLSRGADTNRLKWDKDDSTILGWLFTNQRVYFLLIINIALLVFFIEGYSSFKKWLMVALGALLLYVVFFLFFKITQWIHVAVMSFILISALFSLHKKKIAYPVLLALSLVLLLLNSGWMALRIKKENSTLLNAIAQTHAILTELKQHPDSLFVMTAFNDDGITLWDVPRNFPLTNVVNKELMLTNSYPPILGRFRINDIMQSLALNNNIFVSGKNLPMLKDYYLIKYGWRIELKKIKEFKSLEVYQIRMAN